MIFEYVKLAPASASVAVSVSFNTVSSVVVHAVYVGTGASFVFDTLTLTVELSTPPFQSEIEYVIVSDHTYHAVGV